MSTLKPVSFSDVCPTISYSFELQTKQGVFYPEILVVTFSGRYRDGSAGDPDAKLMKGIIDTAIGIWSPQSILLDLTDFEYVWGDYIEYIFDSPERQTVVTVVGSKCREALSTLLKGVSSREDIIDNERFFESREAALERLENLPGERRSIE